MLRIDDTYNAGLPNVPGMVVHKDSWVYRKIDGFKKSNRPRDSTTTHGRYSATSPYDPSQSYQQRPATASVMSEHERTQRMYMQQSSSDYFVPSAEQTGELYNRRPLTASSARPSTAERTGGLTFQVVDPVPLVARNLPKVAPFVETEKVVARFYGYFNFDRIFELSSVLGPASVGAADPRYLTFLFFVEDQTCEIIEKKQPNSGIDGGLFFARGKTKKLNGEPLELRDLAPGNTVCILGREIHIFDADKFTRDYFRRELKLALPPVMQTPEAMRLDQSAQQATGLGFQRTSNSHNRTNFGVRSTDYLHKKVDNEKSKRFLDFDGRTLRFVCIDAPGSKQSHNGVGTTVDVNVMTGEYELQVPATIKKFVLEYFMSDSSIEMRIQKGKVAMNLDNWLLLKKSRLPSNWQEVQKGMPPVYFDPSDLRVGSIVDIYSRKFLLVECDHYAHEYYRSQGSPQETLKLITVEENIVHEIPKQGDGFLPIGGPEDTLATVFGQAQVSKMDRKVSSKTQNRQLRCKIKIISKNNIDGTRPLQLIYHLNDDSIQIYEEVVRNSGIGGGNYLKRGRYINSLPPAGEEPRGFKPTDIFLGNVFSINGQEMQIVYMDHSTLRFCESYSTDYPMSDTFKIVHRMMEHTASKRLDLRVHFIAADLKGDGWLDETKFVSSLDSWGLTAQLNDQELITILRRFQGLPSTRYLYHEMCDLFSHIFIAQRSHAKMRTTGRMDPRPVDDLSDLLATLRLKTTQWRRAFRKDGKSADGYASLASLSATFKTNGVILSDDAKQLIRQEYSASPMKATTVLLEMRSPEKDKTKGQNLNLKVNKTKLPKGCNLGATKRMMSTTPGSSSRVDLRSQSRMTMTASASFGHTGGSGGLGTMLLDDIDMEQKEAEERESNQQTALQAAIVHRRQKLMTSVLRSDWEDLKRQEQERLAAEKEELFQQDDSSIIINFELLCNDIYICDWA